MVVIADVGAPVNHEAGIGDVGVVTIDVAGKQLMTADTDIVCPAVPSPPSVRVVPLQVVPVAPLKRALDVLGTQLGDAKN